MRALICLGLLAGLVCGQERSVFDEVADAFEAENTAELTRLARETTEDPWSVVDVLCGRGNVDAAAAFAKNVTAVTKHPKDVEALLRYVEYRRTHAYAKTVPAALDRLRGLFESKQFEKALKLCDGLSASGEDMASVLIEHWRGRAAFKLQRWNVSRAAFERAAAIAKRIGWLAMATAAFQDADDAARRDGDQVAAITFSRAALALAQQRGRPDLEIVYLSRLGTACQEAHRSEDAAKHIVAALALAQRERAQPRTLGVLYSNLANVRYQQRRYQDAVELHGHALAAFEKLNDEWGAAVVRYNIARLLHRTGEFGRSLEHFTRALCVFEKHDRQHAARKTIGYIGLVHTSLGDYASALDYLERAWDLSERMNDRHGWAVGAKNLGSLHYDFGDLPKARLMLTKALAGFKAIPDRFRIADTIRALARVEAATGDYDKALTLLKEAKDGFDAVKDAAQTAETVSEIGRIHFWLGHYDRAVACHEAALASLDSIGEIALARRVRMSLAHALWRTGREPDARRIYAGLLTEAQHEGSHWLEAVALMNLAACDQASGRLDDAVSHARRSIARLPEIVAGLSDRSGSGARTHFFNAIIVGTTASRQLGRLEDVFFFMEAGRAGALLETLRSRDALREAALPKTLLQAELEIRRAEARAVDELRAAAAANNQEQLSAAKSKVERVRAKRALVVQRIQREAKDAASVIYPQPVTMAQLQSRLGEDEVIVQLGSTGAFDEPRVIALIITAKKARCIELGSAKEFDALTRRLHADVAGRTEIEAVCASLRARLWAPLKIRRKTVLLAPEGTLCYVPFGLLAPKHEFVYIPSGTTYDLLKGTHRRRGTGVLAVADPAFGKQPSGRAHRGLLRSLPGSRDEARAIGTVPLIGVKATESAFRVAACRQRWRAVHVACHGLIDSERPALSALALGPSDEDDGFLSVMDLFRMKVSADLVVLSACRTAHGKVIRGEGVLGLTRGFMFAGAPRVIVSLWKVDDEATQALMVKFYELWKRGKSTAAALKEAQAFVRAQKKWEHPYYWAAWQLWGLGD